MAHERTGRIEWYAPDPRGVLPLNQFRVPRSLMRLVQRRPFEISIDRDVHAVMRACAGARGPANPSWMNDRLLEAYLELHERGHVHSVEARFDGRLVGGLYGVRLGAAFFGESMFCLPEAGGSNASKICLVHLVERLRDGGFELLDTQMATPHMRRFGCVEIRAAEYMRRLERALQRDAEWKVP